MNLVRRGPRYIFFRTREPDKLLQLWSELEGKRVEELSLALEQAEEDSTIAFITPPTEEDASYIFVSPLNSPAIISSLINRKLTEYIDRIDLGPGQVVMRIPRDGHQVIDEIKEAYQAQTIDIAQGIEQGREEATILSFSEAPIRSRVNSLQLIKDNLLIPAPINRVLRELRRDAIRYITHGLQDSQWYEIKINIYDTQNKYEEQYQRLVAVLADLEAGIILGESWTRDHAIALLSVIAYQIRLFTFLSPGEIKRILLSLEYDENGDRLVDFDLYHNSDKINWYKVIEDGKNYSRPALAVKLRQELYTRLSRSTQTKIEEIEKQL